MSVYKNYTVLDPDTKKHVDEMFELLNDYSIVHNIPIAYDDRAEVLVEAIATFLIESKPKVLM